MILPMRIPMLLPAYELAGAREREHCAVSLTGGYGPMLHRRNTEGRICRVRRNRDGLFCVSPNAATIELTC